jgi:hypothetical protein
LQSQLAGSFGDADRKIDSYRLAPSGFNHSLLSAGVTLISKTANRQRTSLIALTRVAVVDHLKTPEDQEGRRRLKRGTIA